MTNNTKTMNRYETAFFDHLTSFVEDRTYPVPVRAEVTTPTLTELRALGIRNIRETVFGGPDIDNALLEHEGILKDTPAYIDVRKVTISFYGQEGSEELTAYTSKIVCALPHSDGLFLPVVKKDYDNDIDSFIHPESPVLGWNSRSIRLPTIVYEEGFPGFFDDPDTMVEEEYRVATDIESWIVNAGLNSCFWQKSHEHELYAHDIFSVMELSAHENYQEEQAVVTFNHTTGPGRSQGTGVNSEIIPDFLKENGRDSDEEITVRKLTMEYHGNEYAVTSVEIPRRGQRPRNTRVIRSVNPYGDVHHDGYDHPWVTTAIWEILSHRLNDHDFPSVLGERSEDFPETSRAGAHSGVIVIPPVITMFTQGQ